MQKYVIVVTGNVGSDVELALGEVTRLVREGYHKGYHSDDSGSYEFYREEE